MNDLKTLIKRHLGKSKEATAKQIAAAIGHREAQSSVNNALNALRTEGVVECEKRKGKGNELTYWLASVAPGDDDAMPEADANLLALANRELSERIRLLLGSIGIDDDSGAGIVIAAKLAENHRDKSAKLKDAEAEIEALRLNLKITGTAEKQRNAWREAVGDICGEDTPAAAAAYIAGLKRRVAELEAAKLPISETPKVQQKRLATPRRPFTVTGLTGYHAQNGRVTLFVDRRLSARSITLPADRLNQLAEMARGA